ncbi:CUE domain-containing protein [Mycena chlorophos]|uniref:CUE domain-containing protein n=1 Tax=Mycena chlorophos TaxID=658473 RepID=A0A8H6S8I3_MYCCL|nr:CUE domain-containing protein [Mycena chlorophos]
MGVPDYPDALKTRKSSRAIFSKLRQTSAFSNQEHLHGPAGLGTARGSTRARAGIKSADVPGTRPETPGAFGVYSKHAPVTKGLMAGIALTSILVGVFDVKHYFHLQLVPHLSQYYQYWRLPLHHLAFSSSGELFVGEILLFNTAIQVERQFGSQKFASFVVLSLALSTLFSFISLLLIPLRLLTYLPPGVHALLFATLYQHVRIVPPAYSFRILGVTLTSASFMHLLALQLALSHIPGSAVAAIVGILVGMAYRSDLTPMKSWRLPRGLVEFGRSWAVPLLGSLKAARRSNRALPDGAPTPTQDEVITTSRLSAFTSTQRRQPQPSSDGAPSNAGNTPASNANSVMREWVSGIAGRAPAGLRIPTEAEIGQLAGMFPDVRREVLVTTLQRSANIEAAVETLLSSAS